MVKNILATLLGGVVFVMPSLCPRAWGEMPGPVKFRMEFNKPEIFFGEQVLCHFNVYTMNDLIEVEVAKFPEFRGFWNENLILRQGPLATLFGLTSSPQMATVGTYVLIPMLGQARPTIEPMKIVLRSPASRRVEGSTPPEFVLSEGVALKIKPLPPLPPQFSPAHFVGAVGRFNTTPEPVVVPFQPGEPAMLQLSLIGQGNFPEINRLPIPFPNSVEVVSERAYLQGGSQSGSKTFEYNVTLKEAAEFSIPTTPFIYFDPDLKKYVSISLPEIQFKKMEGASEKLAMDRTQQLPSFDLRESPQLKKVNRSTLPLWFVNAIGLSLFLVALLWKTKTIIAERRAISEIATLFDRAEQTLEQTEGKSFLSALESYVYAWVTDRASIRDTALPRRALLQLAEPHLTDRQKELAERLSGLCDALLYRPDHASVPDLANLRREVFEAFPPPRQSKRA